MRAARAAKLGGSETKKEKNNDNDNSGPNRPKPCNVLHEHWPIRKR
jgi:hypothetical protein